MMAPRLSVELRETIQAWFAARNKPIQDSAVILAALADLATEQIAANPMGAAQIRVMNCFLDDIIRGCNAANRRQMGGIACTIVKQ
jgi:hypothetical protein